MPPARTAPRNICILRLSALGDVSHVVPVVRAIQDQLPDARLTWVCGRPEHQVLAGIEGVRFVIFDKAAGLSAYFTLRRELAAERFDTLLHMQVAARANLASRCIRAEARLGWDKARSRDLHQWFINRRIEAGIRQHQVQGFLSFARALGLEAGEPHWDLPVSADAIEFARRVLPGGQPTLLISPCSSHALRDWPPHRYAAAADHAARRLGMRVALAGGRNTREAATGAAIEKAMKVKPVNLIGKDTLAQSLALLKRASIVLAPDAGPAHLANALGTPVVGLYAATWSKRSGPYNSLDLCVDRYAEAARRYLGREPESLRWGTRIEKPGVMDLVELEDVIERLEHAAQRLPQA